MLLENMNFSVSSLMASLIFGIIGWYLFSHGRKNANNHFVVIGIALMVYPYLTKGPLADWGIGAGLCGLAYYYKNR